MKVETILSIGVILLYSLSTLGIVLGALARRQDLKRLANRLALAGFALHTLAVGGVFVTHTLAGLPSFYYMQFMAWSIIFLYLCAWRWLRFPFLGLTAAPVALLLYILSMRLSSDHSLLPEHLSGLFFTLHIWSLYFSLGLLTLAFGAGVLFLYMENRLKRKLPLADFAKDLPSLATYDKVNHIAVLAGFPLYTLGLMAGFIWAPMGRAVTGNPKALLSLVIWLLYALLFYQRAALRYRGRKTAIMVIAIVGVSAISIAIDHTMAHHSAHFLP